MTKRRLPTLCAGLFAACLSCVAVASSSSTKSTFESAYKQAASLQKEAVTKECAWNVTQDALEQAKAAASKKDYGTAIKKAQRATDLARLSLQQAEAQKSLWQKAVVH